MAEHDTEIGALLLARARRAIGRELGVDAPEPGDDPRLSTRGATFVTLKKHGELRGCIGSLRPQRALRDDVEQNAVAAATHDYRFPPVTTDELNELKVEVSLLSEPTFVEFSDRENLLRQLKPGVHGVILSAGCQSATFLPQVWEQLPEPADFLAALLRKAGLAPDYPVKNLVVATYTVQKWHE